VRFLWQDAVASGQRTCIPFWIVNTGPHRQHPRARASRPKYQRSHYRSAVYYYTS